MTKKDAAKSVALFVLKLADGISNICGERDQLNQATQSQLPAVLPHQWVKLGTGELVEILRQQRDRLLVQQDREFIRLVEEDHKALKRALSSEEPLHEILEKHDTNTNFAGSGG